MKSATTGDLLLITIGIGGVALSGLFSSWLINLLVNQAKEIGYINEVVTDIRTMEQMRQRLEGLNK